MVFLRSTRSDKLHSARARRLKQLRNRRSVIEQLEDRRLLIGSPWSNGLTPLNVNDDPEGLISPVDVLQVVNELNGRFVADPVTGSLPPVAPSGQAPPPFLDVNCDQIVSPIDALLIINHLNGSVVEAGPVFTTNTGQSGRFSPLGCGAILRESDSFVSTLTARLIIPSDAASLTFELNAIEFDTSSQASIQDAFEVALLDLQGRSLVQSIAAGRDAYYNTSEQLPALGASRVIVAEQRITLSLQDVLPNTAADLVFRLVNNDSDTQTAVTIGSVEFSNEFRSGEGLDRIPTSNRLDAGGPNLDPNSALHADAFPGPEALLPNSQMPGASGLDSSILRFNQGIGTDLNSKSDGTMTRVDGSTASIARTTSVSPRNIDIGRMYSDRIASVGDIQQYEFDAISGSRIFLDVQIEEFLNFKWNVLDTTSDKSTNWIGFDDQLITIENTGRHVLSIERTRQGDGYYQFQTWEAKEHVHDIAIGDVVSGSIDVPGTSHTYLFSGIAGQNLALEVYEGRGIGISRVYTLTSPTGEHILREVSNPGNFTLPEDGQYELAVFDRIFPQFKLAIDHIGPFGFRLKDQTDSSTVTKTHDLIASNVNWNWIDHQREEIEVAWELSNDSASVISSEGLYNRIVLFDVRGDKSYPSQPIRGFHEIVDDLVVEGDLLPNSKRSISTKLSIPDYLTGEFQIGVLADVFNAVPETNEVNNFSSTNLIAVPSAPIQAGGVIQIDNYDAAQSPGSTVVLTGNALASRASSNTIVVIDVSGSTGLEIDDEGNEVGPLVGFDTNGDGIINDLDNPNGDERVGDLLDVEINAAIAAINRLPLDGTQAVSVVAFGSTSFVYGYPITAALDLSEQPYRQTSVILDASSLPNIEMAIRTLKFKNPFHSYSEASLFHDITLGSGNDLGLVMSEVERLLNIAPAAEKSQIIFLGDGDPTTEGDVTLEQLERVASLGVEFNVFQINGAQLAEPFVRMVNVFESFPDSSGTGTILSSPEDLYSALSTENVFEAVYINGVAVDALDGSGDFFASYDVQPGLNNVEISAMDSFGSTSRTTIQITGTDSQAAIDVSKLTDISPAFAGTYGRTSFNDDTSTLFINLATSNQSAFDIDVPLLVGIRNLRPVEGSQGFVSVIGEDGRLSDGTPYVDFSPYVEGSRLVSGKTTAAPSIQFHNPQRVQFTYELVFYSKLNSVPEITSVPSLEALSGRAYTYEVTARDADGDTLSYRLLQAPAGMTINSASGAIAWTPESSQIGSQTVSIAVSDARGGDSLQDYALTTLTAPPNRPPVISSVPKTSFVLGNSPNYEYLLKAADVDQDPLTYELVVGEFPTGMVIDSATGLIRWTPEGSQIGTHNVQVQVNDGRGGVATQQYEICVHPSLPSVFAPSSNSAPIFTSTLPSAVVQDRKISVDLTVVDADRDSITVSLASSSLGQLVTTQTTLPDGTNGAIRYQYEWTPSGADVTAGVRTIRLEARDGSGGLGVLESSVIVVTEAANEAPAITSLPTKYAYSGLPYRYLVRSIDPDGHELSTTLAASPAGMTVNADGLIEWNPPAGFNTSANVEVIVADSFGGSARQAFTIVARNEFSNSAPSVISSPRGTVRDSNTYVYDAKAVDAEGDIVTWTLEVAPNGMAVDAESGSIRWNPEESQIGKHQVVLTAADIFGASSTQSFEIEVTCVNAPPVIRSVPITSAYVDDRYLYSVRADDVDRDPLQFRLLSTVAGMTISPLGLIRWTPSAADLNQTRNVVIEVTDGQGGVAVQRYDLVVGQKSSANKAPSIESTPVFVARTGNSYQYNVVATDVDGDQVTYRLSQKPSWMSIDTTLGLITGTPTAPGSVSVAVEAVDSHGAISTQAFTIAVRDNQAPIINSSPATSTSPNAVYRYYVRANDPDGDSLRYSLADAPAGMRIDGNGLLRWSTPDASTEPVPVTVQVSDPYGGVAEQTFVLSLVADTTPPQVSIIASTNIIDIGGVIQLQVQASDNIGVVEQTLTVGEQQILLDASGRGYFTGSKQELVDAIATAKDAAGNSSQSRIQLRVLDPTDEQGPRVVISNPSIKADVTYLTDIVGSVTVPSGQQLEFYRVEFAPAEQVDLNNIGSDTPSWRVISQGNTPVVNGKLATFDPTMLRNGGYVIRVVAFNTNGKGWAEPLPISVHGAAKFGEFQLEFTDLIIPLAGIPIQITRQYSSLDANVSNDFGYGWTLRANDPHILESGLDSKTVFLSDERSFLPGRTKVYLTNPEGRRVGFTYTEEPETIGIFSTVLRPKYIPDPGVYDQLDSPGTIGRGLFGFVGYNPSEYTLTTKDGTKYRYTEANGLGDITDLNDNKITFTDSAISHSDGTEIQFIRDGLGRIREIVDPDGNRIRYVYDAAGNLVKFINQTNLTTRYTYHSNPAHYLNEVFDSRGIITLQVVYAADGRYMHVVDALGNIANAQQTDLPNRQAIVKDGNGNETKLRFDNRGNILEETDPLGNKTVREYDDPRHPDLETRVTDSRGFPTTLAYDVHGNIAQRIDAVGQVWSMTYDTHNKLLTEKDPRGIVLTNSYDAFSNLVSTVDHEGNVTRMSYDGSGRMINWTDPAGNTWHYEYSNSSNPIRITNPDGTTRQWTNNSIGLATTHTDENGHRISLDLDDSGRPMRIIGPDGGTAIINYSGELLTSITNERGFTNRFSFDVNNRLVTETDPLGGQKHYIYDTQGNILSRTDERGNRTEYVYDPRNLVIVERDPLGFETRFAYDAAENLIAVIDAKGRITRLEYDAINRLTALIDPAGFRWTFSYNSSGDLTSRSDPRGAVTQFEHDGRDNLIRQIDALGGVQIWDYDSRGNVIRYVDERGNAASYSYDSRNRLRSILDSAGFTQHFDYDLATNVTSYKDQLGSETRFSFDARNRITARTASNGATTSYAYDFGGNLTQITDPLSRVTSFSYDELDRLIREIDPLRATTSYIYDGTNNLTSLTDPKGHSTSWSYDALNRAIVRTDPLGNSEYYAYDSVGNLSEYVDRNGRKRTYAFDLLDQLITETWHEPSGGSVVETLHFAYDSVGNLTEARGGDSVLRLTYDFLDRVLTESNEGTFEIPSVAIASRYDAASNRVEVSDNYGVTSNSSYDSRNLLTLRGWSGGGIAPARVELSYTPRGQVNIISRFASLAGGNAINKTILTHDEVGRIQQIDHKNNVDQSILDFDYEFDLADQLIEWAIGGREINFQYDQSGQVVSADRQGGANDEMFSYDVGGNRIGGGVTIGENNRLLADETFDYSYDLEGNLIKKAERATGKHIRFDYDHHNRMTSATEYSAIGEVVAEVSYRFDAIGRRIARTEDADGAGPNPATTEVYVYDGDNVWLDADGNGNVRARYLFGDSADEIIARWNPNQGTSWFLTDHLGSIHSVIDASGKFVASVIYDSFGGIVAVTNPELLGRYLFTGREYDASLGTYYYRARMYDPATGRFQSEDPIGFRAGDTNLSRYVRNAPTNSTDPSGQKSAKEYGLIAASIILRNRYVLFEIGQRLLCIYQAVANSIDAAEEVLALFECLLPNKKGPGSPPRKGGGGGPPGSNNGPGPSNNGPGPSNNGPGPSNSGPGPNNGGRGASGRERGAPSASSTGTNAPVKTAAERATEIHQTLGKGTQGRTTTAVTETAEGVRVVSSSELRLRPAQRRALQPGEVEGVGPGHAEVTGVNAANGMGLTPTGTAASRPICPSCADTLQQQGVQPLSPLKKRK